MNWKLFALPTGLFLACAIGTAMGQPVGPPAGYKINADYTATSPDGTTTIEQYAKTDADGDYAWQFWARRQDKLTMLEPEQPDYAAGFRFTNDSQWVVRTQKTGAGEAGLYLYKIGAAGFCCRNAEAARRSRLGIFQQPSRFPENPKAGFPYRGGSAEGR
jgi:hypothetical protein